MKQTRIPPATRAEACMKLYEYFVERAIFYAVVCDGEKARHFAARARVARGLNLVHAAVPTSAEMFRHYVKEEIHFQNIYK